MVGVMTFPKTTIGKKVIMAITGAVWVGYLVMHMYGNLKVFTGAEHFNEYAAGLRTLGAPIFGYAHLLTIARLIFVGSIVLHIWAATTLTLHNRASRSVKYTMHTKLRGNSANLTMIYGGIAIFVFIIYHLMHFTFGTPVIHPDFDGHDAYSNVVIGFQSYGYIPAIIYLMALVPLAFHLFHGVWSMFQTLGLNNKTYTGMLRGLAWLIAIVIPAGFALVPLAVIFGILTL